jgi:hypothetical protein
MNATKTRTVTRSQDPSKKVVAFGVKARKSLGMPADLTTCPTCGRALNDPYRRIIDGKYSEGCVDAHHTGHLPEASNTYSWHWRTAAIQVRMATYVLLTAV